MVDIGNFDFNAIVDFVKSALWQAVQIPFEIWRSLPAWFKISLLVMILIICAFLLVWWLKNKEEWRRLSY
jgi:hypothetical protein